MIDPKTGTRFSGSCPESNRYRRRATNTPGPPAISGRPEAAMNYKWFLFSFNGRINRAKYWLATLIILCWMIFVLEVLAAVAPIFGIGGPLAINVIGISASIQLGGDPASKASLFPQIVTIPMTFVFGWSYAAASIKRLHDRNKSGWWIVPFIVATGLYGQFGDRLGGSYAAVVIGLAVFIAFMWGFVEMCCLTGTRGPNRFGPDPLAPPDAGPRWDQFSELEMVPHRADPSVGE
jgi:uncharacterized membrane protein YhaH (DUF805 family)